MRWWLAVLLLTALPLHAEQVVLGLSQDRVSITATFDGSDILVFGAVKRETPIPQTPMEVIVTIEGPSPPVLVRRKARRFGIWVNTETVEVNSAPSFYSISTSAPLAQALTETEDLRHRITIDRAIRSVGAPATVSDAGAFSDALIRIRLDKGLYQVNEESVAFDEQTLFRTSVRLPANLTEGGYTTRIFLTREGQVVADFDTVIEVRKVGLERWLYTLSREEPLLYGLMSLAIAIAAGWGASAIFRILRHG